MDTALRSVPLFAGLDDDHLDRLAAASHTVSLQAGAMLFSEGDPGDTAYLIERGEVEILKGTGDGELLLAVRSPGDVIGEIALLQELPRTASVRARRDSVLVAIPRAALDELMSNSTAAGRALLRVLLERWQSTNDQLRRRERMAQLGTLTAGLAHELNNPAAAVARSAEQLSEAMGALTAAERALSRSLPESIRGALEHLTERLDDPAGRPALASLEHSDLEVRVEELMEEAGVSEPWLLAPDLVDAGLADLVPQVVGDLGADAGDVLRLVRAHAAIGALLSTITMGTSRMSAIVRALKSYSYLDQAPVQELDIAVGIADTLVILSSKLSGITVVTDLSPDLPPVEGHGGELNQVWTNLIDNAADAISASGRTDGVITIRARPHRDDAVLVEVEDNGVGIPAGAVDRVFDSFFTTKAPGAGTGLGLAISFGIVVDNHGGSISVDSVAGRTVFQVELNRRLPPNPHS